MKRERLISALWAVTLSSCSAIGGLGMMVSGLELRANMVLLIPLCLLAAVGLCALLSWRPGGWIAAGCGAAVWLLPAFRQQLKAIVRQIATYMSMAYDTPIPEFLTGDIPRSLEPVLLVLGCIIMGLWIRCILKGKTTVVVIGVSLIPLISCVTVTDTVPKVPWIFLWALPLVLLIMTQSLRRKDAAQGNRLSAMLLVPAILAMAGLFWLIPEKEANQWTVSGTLQEIAAYLPFTQETPDGIKLDLPTASLSDQVILNTLGERTLNDREIMEVSADRAGTLYLRGRDYDFYSGSAWISTSGREEEMTILPDSISTGEGEVRLEVQYRKDYYYLPCYGGETVLLQDGMIKNTLRSRSYAFQTRSLLPNWKQQVLGSPPDYSDTMYLQLPEDTQARAIAYLQDTIMVDDWSDPEKAELIASLVSGCAEYDLNPDRMPAEQNDLAMWFLEDADRGYCVHFATTAAVLLRAAGIHARYVEGYLIETQPGQTVSVEQRHGHAWVEYYVHGAGWVILDATPAEAMQSTETAPEETTEDTAPTTTEPATTQPTRPQETQPVVSTNPTEEFAFSWLPLVISTSVLVCGVIMVGTQYSLRRRRKRQRMYTGHPNAQALARYRELVRLADCLDLPIPKQMTQLAEKAKFSRHTLTDQELELLTAQITEVQQNLQALSLRKRLAAKFIWVLC